MKKLLSFFGRYQHETGTSLCQRVLSGDPFL